MTSAHRPQLLARRGIGAAFVLCACLAVCATMAAGCGSSSQTKPGAQAASPTSILGGHTPLRLLIMGDSEADTLGVGLALANPPVTRQPGAGMFGGGQIGCGLVFGANVRLHGQVMPMPAPCNVGTPAAQRWPAQIRAEIATDHPNVVLVVSGRIEVLDQQSTVGSAWQNILEPAGAQAVRQQLELAAQIGVDGHAHVELATAPYYSSGLQPDGQAWPEDDPARVRAYNALVRSVAAADPGQVSVVDLNALVCPGGIYQATVDGVTVRAPDGVHYPYYSLADANGDDPDSVSTVTAFGRWLAPRLLPEILGTPG